MPSYLLDTNALSIVAPRSEKSTVSPLDVASFRKWVHEHNEDLFLSSVTLAEIQSGISRLERKGATLRAADLSQWLGTILDFYQSRILPLTTPIALEAGRLLDRAIGSGADPGFENAAIAATAAVHGLTIVTANRRHFDHFGLPLISPEP